MIRKSPNDSKTYNFFTLKNKIKVITITKHDTKKSASALSIKTGSHSDPDDLAGLAHFVEHLLFMGTKKYPDENEYSEFLSLHNGTNNAYTTDEKTVYYFDVDSNYLKDALDRFAQFFISPLFNSDSVSREISAVHSEFLNSLSQDNYREEWLSCILSKYPFNKFTMGSKDTLDRKDIRERVLRFFYENYQPSKMTLVIYGKECQSVLKEYAEIFEKIDPKRCDDIDTIAKNNDKDENKNHEKNDDSQVNTNIKDFNPYETDNLGFVYYLNPKNNINTLNIKIVLPYFRKYSYNTYEFIQYSLERASEDSIVGKLKRKNLIFSLNTTISRLEKHTLLEIEIDLTEMGIIEYPKIIKELTMFEIADLKTLQKIQNNEWLLFEEKEPQELVLDFIEKVDYVDIEDLILSDFLTDGIFIDHNLKEMVRNYQNWLVILSSKTYFEDLNCDKEDTVNKSPLMINKSCLMINKSCLMKDKIYGLVYFKGPEIKKICEAERKKPITSRKYEIGKNIMIHVQNQSFSTTKNELKLLIKTKVEIDNLLYYRLLEETFIEKFYDEIQINLISFSVVKDEQGLIIEFSGLNSLDFLLLFLKTKIDKKLVQIVYEKVKNEFVEKDGLPSYKYCTLGLQKIVSNDFKLPFESLNELNKVKMIRRCFGNVKMMYFGDENHDIFDKFLEITKIFHKTNKNYYKTNNDHDIENLNSRDDNIKKNNDHDIKNEVIEIIKDDFIDVSAFLATNNISNTTDNDSSKSRLKFGQKNKDKFDLTIISKNEENAVGIFKEICLTNNIKKNVILRLISQWSCELFFDQLRTKEQLGYVAISHFLYLKNKLYSYFIVQSIHDQELVHARIRNFFIKLKNLFGNIDLENFNSLKESLINNLSEEFYSLSEFAEYFWDLFLRDCFDLEFREKCVEVIQKLTIDDLKAIINEIIGLKNDDLKNADLKNDDLKNDDLKNDDLKNDDLKNDDLKNADLKNDDLKNDDLKNDDLKNDDLKNDDLKEIVVYVKSYNK
ncbi:Insulin-degrading enzyme [Dictyocoela muelleri]|nr:Insulin-degrading enzyme [Dictyocoela muelleri]